MQSVQESSGNSNHCNSADGMGVNDLLSLKLTIHLPVNCNYLLLKVDIITLIGEEWHGDNNAL